LAPLIVTEEPTVTAADVTAPMKGGADPVSDTLSNRFKSLVILKYF